MKFVEWNMRGVFLIGRANAYDSRGMLSLSFNRAEFAEKGLVTEWDRMVSTVSLYGTVRGLHYQSEPYGETKLVTVLSGTIFDVLLDLRPQSETYGETETVELDSRDSSLYVPRGVAHGFQVTSSDALVHYLIAGKFVPSSATGVVWNDPTLRIDWPDKVNAFVSQRDAALPSFKP